MIILGLVLLLLGYFLPMHLLLVIGIILLIVGLVVNFIPLGGSAHRYW